MNDVINRRVVTHDGENLRAVRAGELVEVIDRRSPRLPTCRPDVRPVRRQRQHRGGRRFPPQPLAAGAPLLDHARHRQRLKIDPANIEVSRGIRDHREDREVLVILPETREPRVATGSQRPPPEIPLFVGIDLAMRAIGIAAVASGNTRASKNTHL